MNIYTIINLLLLININTLRVYSIESSIILLSMFNTCTEYDIQYHNQYDIQYTIFFKIMLTNLINHIY